jgi:hypothetical protein
MQKKEYILGKGGGEALCGGVIGPSVAVETLGLFLLPTRRPGRRFTGTDDKASQQGPWTYSYYREDSRDPAFPPAHRCSGAIHLHRPWG